MAFEDFHNYAKMVDRRELHCMYATGRCYDRDAFKV